MKSLGIVRRVDDLGRIVIPKETRQVLFINEGDALEIFKDEGEIILKKYSPGCTFCGNMDNILEFKGLCICGECKNDLKSNY
ncbi:MULTISPECIES: AbrB/MazE/SpoVT family DNA-binding domain-containing protein [unclassified Clostridium]|uniref:AbrB/MazE/SpoVT family DNA-binding domain-containing protein n=1 Tax=unclassified Clostridium TaxID=2614128 RepID=UPI000297878C|nr:MULTISPECIES: AbrB/MazE/SpoVT family DNA-binding domain-containing protein [unclassified Clostridium]EKQ57987.1 MAG: looped-hinge helix DNA binding domain, AbrB family [Clostridium sp. Maddingley MBC34-26]